MFDMPLGDTSDMAEILTFKLQGTVEPFLATFVAVHVSNFRISLGFPVSIAVLNRCTP
jgi:hypothetical protein